MKARRSICLVLAAFFTAVAVHAQTCTILGKVVDAKTGEPLAQANVFINRSTIGATSDPRGNFVLSNVRQPGTYELVISLAGYISFKRKLTLESGQMDVGTLTLDPTNMEVNTGPGKASASGGEEREKKLKRFKKMFLGDDKAAAQCVILNPQVIDFQNNGPNGRIAASANEPLEIENKALGYKLIFYPSAFEEGRTDFITRENVRFEFLKPADERVLQQWEQNREISYSHSSQHLFRALVDSRVSGEGFNLYATSPGDEHPVATPRTFRDELGKSVTAFDTSTMVTPTGRKDIYQFALSGKLEVHDTRAKAASKVYRDIGYPVTWIAFTTPSTLINKEGAPLNPSEIVISGAMAGGRVAQMLPMDYLPMGMLVKMSKNEEYRQAMDLFYEKIYVHTDKSYYYPGETLWFKGYVNYSNRAMRDSLSRTVYAEFIHGPSRKVVRSKILPLDSGTFSGDFILPDTLKPSDCYLRAYTNLNRNYGDNHLYVKFIPLLAPFEKPEPIDPVNTILSGSVKISTDKPSYSPREEIKVSFQLEGDGKELPAVSLSVSVTDASQVVALPGTTILTDFPLREIPRAKYFSWRAEYGIGFTARLKNGKSKPLRETVNIFQLSPKNFFVSETDGYGVFSLTNLNFYDTSSFSFQTSKGDKQILREAELLGKSPPFVYQPSPRTFAVTAMQSSQRQESAFEIPKNTRLLKEVVVKGEKIDEPGYQHPYGRPDYVIKSTAINTSYGNLLLTLPGKVPGLVIRQVNNKAGTQWVVYIQRAGQSVLNPQEVTILVNNAVMGGTAGDILGSIDPSSVESVEVTTRLNSLLGSLGCCGVINIFTKQGVSGGKDENIPSLKIAGYSKPRKFPVPDYGEKSSGEVKVDRRAVLYWNPGVKIRKGSGLAVVSFYAPDHERTYRVVVEGVTERGKPVHGEYLIKPGH